MSLGADLILPRTASVSPGQSQPNTSKEVGQSGFAGVLASAREAGDEQATSLGAERGMDGQAQEMSLLEEQNLAGAGNDLPPLEDALLAEPEPVSLETLLFGRTETRADKPENDESAPALDTPNEDASQAEGVNQAVASQTLASLAQPVAVASPAAAQVPTAAVATSTRVPNGVQDARSSSRQAEQSLLADEPPLDRELSAEEGRDFTQALRGSVAAAGADAQSAASADTPDSPVNPLTQAVQQAAAQREAAAAAQQQPLSLRQPGLSEAVVERVMWLSSQNLRSAEIQLDPAELGRLEIRISLNQEQAHISFASPHASVREALEGQMHRLREMFAQQGLDQLDVNVSDQSLARGDRQAGERDPSGFAGRAGDADVELDDETVIASTPLDAGRGLVDFYA